MLNCEQMAQIIKKYNFNFFAGVPDSTFKDWLKFLTDDNSNFTHIATSNEADSIAITTGYHLATNQIGIAYMQNSGLGNCVNPLTSLADEEVYSIPILLLIGWRGMPGVKDEPQHKKMGRITLALLDVLEIPYAILSEKPEELDKAWSKAYDYMRQNNKPYAIILRKGIFKAYKTPVKSQMFEICREEAIKIITQQLTYKHVIVATTGQISRELYEYRYNRSQSHEKDFYTVGSMGCSASIGMGIAQVQKEKEVIIFDGDGAALMHLGSWAPISSFESSNFKHIIFDNECYGSTGSQPTLSDKIDFGKIALGFGYKYADHISTYSELNDGIKKLVQTPGPGMLIIKTNKNFRKNLIRPKTTPIENKTAFMNFLNKLKG